MIDCTHQRPSNLLPSYANIGISTNLKLISIDDKWFDDKVQVLQWLLKFLFPIWCKTGTYECQRLLDSNYNNKKNNFCN